MNISVIIPTFGRPGHAHAVASAIAPQLRWGDRICIVNQQDPPAAGSKQEHIESLYLGKAGLPQARNAGIRATTAEVVLFLDDDVVPFEGLLEAHRMSYEDAGVGAVAGFVDDPLFDRTLTEPSCFDESTGELRQNFSFCTSKDTISFMGANFSVRRSALEQIGLFDGHFTRNALWEDVDVAFRIRAAGWKIWFCAEAGVRHERVVMGGCRSDRGVRYVYHQFANTAYFACRHAPRRHARSWARFWWHRLEYLSRTPDGVLRRSIIMVAAALAGAAAGMARYLTR